MHLPRLTPRGQSRVESWAKTRCVPDTFKMVDELGVTGGILKREPRSLLHFQAAIGNNLHNWGVDRDICERGWLRFVSVEDLSHELGLVAATERRRRDYNKWFHDIVIPNEVLRREQQAQTDCFLKIQSGLERLQRVFSKRTREAFDTLAADIGKLA